MVREKLNGFRAKENKKLLTLSGLLVVLAILGVRLVFQGPESADAFGVNGTAGMTDEPIQTIKPLHSKPEVVVRLEELNQMERDPFWSSAFEKPDPDPEPVDQGLTPQMIRETLLESLNLQGTVHSGDRRAVINDAVYRIGDRIEGAELTRISAESVHLDKDGTEVVLRLSR